MSFLFFETCVVFLALLESFHVLGNIWRGWGRGRCFTATQKVASTPNIISVPPTWWRKIIKKYGHFDLHPILNFADKTNCILLW